MKYLVLFYICGLWFSSFGQTNSDIILIDEPFEIQEQDSLIEDGFIDLGGGSDASYPGESDAMFKFLMDSLNYPDSLGYIEANDWTVFVRFKVLKDGSLADFTCVKGSELLCQSVINVLKKMPKWIPSYYKGEAVESTFTLPVHFHPR